MAIGQFTLPAVSNLANLLAALQAGPGASLTGGNSNLDPSSAVGSLEDLVANQQNYSDLVKQAAVNRLQSLASPVGESLPSSVGAALPSSSAGVYTPGHGYSAAGVSPDRGSEINEIDKQLRLNTNTINTNNRNLRTSLKDGTSYSPLGLPTGKTVVRGPKPEKIQAPLIAPKQGTQGLLGYLKNVVNGVE